MIEALWSVEFISNLQGAGAGVALQQLPDFFGAETAILLGLHEKNLQFFC